MDDVVKGDNILMLQLLHQRDFADGGAWRAFFAVEVDFFERNEFTGLPIPAFENLTRHTNKSRRCVKTSVCERTVAYVPSPSYRRLN